VSNRPTGRGTAGVADDNDKETVKLANAAGGLVVNFGGLELQTYFYLELLRGGGQWPSDLVGKNRKPFAIRADMVISELKASRLQSAILDEALAAWDLAKEYAKSRNIILHSPVLHSWIDKPAEGPPILVGFADVGHADKGQCPNISADSVDKFSDQVRRLVLEIVRVYDRLKKAQS